MLGTSATLTEDVPLSSVRIRPLEDGETEPLLAVFDGLEPRSRELRFLAPKLRLTPTDLCQLSHVGHVVSGKLRVSMADGTEKSISAGESYTIPPGHDAWVEGNEPFVGIEVMSADVYAKPA